MSESYRLLSVDQALEIVLASVEPLSAEGVPIMDTLGRVLAEDVVAEMDVPPLSNSAMDGYAIRAADTAGATAQSPCRLRVIHDLAAGYTTDVQVSSGTAVRIMTGAPIPAGADTVVPFEETTTDETDVLIATLWSVGKNIRLAGEDVRRGQVILHRGAEIRPQEVGMLAALGKSQALCLRRPRIGILATGDEVIEVDAPWQPGKIRNANSYTNAAQVRKYGGLPIMLGIARDTVSEITGRLRASLDQGVDLLLTSGGISVGDFDLVKRVLAAEGEIAFWQVQMRPGKPLAFGHIGGVPLVGLPGNPVSAMVSFELFVRPAILKMRGLKDLSAPTVRAILAEDIKVRPGSRHLLRVMLEKREGTLSQGEPSYWARLTGEQGSGILLSLVRAHGLAVIPEGVSRCAAGDAVDVVLLS